MGRTKECEERRRSIQKLKTQGFSKEDAVKELNESYDMVDRWWDRASVKELPRKNNRLGTALFGTNAKRAIVELHRLLRCSYAQMSTFLKRYVIVLSPYTAGTSKIPRIITIHRTTVAGISKNFVKLPRTRKLWGLGDIAAHAVCIGWTEKTTKDCVPRSAKEAKETKKHAWVLVFACRWYKSPNTKTSKLSSTKKHNWKIEWHLFPEAPTSLETEELLVKYVKNHRKANKIVDVTIHLVSKPGPLPVVSINATSLRKKLNGITVLTDEVTNGMPGEITISPALRNFDALRNKIAEMVEGKECRNNDQEPGDQPIRKLARPRKYRPRKKLQKGSTGSTHS